MKKIYCLLMIILLGIVITSCKDKTRVVTLYSLDDVETIEVVVGDEFVFQDKHYDEHIFLGWYDENDQLVTNAIINDDVSFTAKYISYGTTWNITYELNGGEFKFNPHMSYTTGKSLVIGEPTAGYNIEFLGWYLNDEYIEIIPEDMYGDITLVAKWSDNNVYHTVNYNLDDEVEMPEEYVTKYIEGLEYSLPVPKKFGYFFRGWYTDKEYSQRIKSITTSNNLDLELYPCWVKKTRENAYVSFLGDSITTYEGIIPTDFPTYYPAGDVDSIDKTWWKLALERSNCNLLSNNSYSGSYVSQGTMYAASMKRLELLSKDGIDPDVVVIYMGTNDLTHDIRLTKFTMMYKEMIENIKFLYDDVDIFVLTMPSNTYALKFNEPRIKMNDSIKEIAKEYGLFLVDLVDLINSDNVYECMYGGAHPNAKGMEIIGKEVGILLSREYKRYWLGE